MEFASRDDNSIRGEQGQGHVIPMRGGGRGITTEAGSTMQEKMTSLEK